MAYSKAKISIPNVTGNIVITATATASAGPTNILVEVGYQNGKRYSLSSSNADKLASGSGFCATNQIPVSSGDYIKIKGLTFSATYKGIMAAFDSSHTYLTGSRDMIAGNSYSGDFGTITIDSNNILTWTFTGSQVSSSIAYIGISGGNADIANLFATKNEELPA